MPMWREDKELSKYNKYKVKTYLAKMGQVVSMLALLTCSLGGLHLLACACIGFAYILGRCKSRVVTVVTITTLMFI